MNKILIKALSINVAWAGRRFKTPLYKNYEEELLYKLPAIDIPEGKLEAHYIFGFSSKNADLDNPVKLFTDVLQKKYGFNDKRIYKMVIEKVDVKKGEEFISFNFLTK